MSMVPSGMGFANVLSPLHQSLIRTMPNAASMSPIPPGDQANTLVRAHNLRTGNISAGQMTPGDRSGGPMGQSISKYKTAMMAAIGMSEEDQHKFKDAVNDPYVSPAAFKQLVQMHQQTTANQAKHPGLQTPTPGQQTGGASIGGGPMAGLPQGSMQITRGHGPNAMSEEAMGQWMRRAAHQAGQGEEVSEVRENAPVHGLSRAAILAPPQQPTGFRVSGIQAPAQQQQQAATPMQGLLQSFQSAGLGEREMGQLHSLAEGGASPMQIHQAGQQLLQRKQDFEHRQHTEQVQTQHQQTQLRQQEFANNARVLDELQRQARNLIDAHPELKYGNATDPNVQKDWMAVNGQIQSVQSRLQQNVTPQQQQQQQQPAPGGKPVQIASDADYSNLPSGALFVGPDGHMRRKP